MSTLEPVKNIAIVGIAARFSEATNAQSLWELINDQTPTLQKIATPHFDIDSIYDPDPNAGNKSYCNRATMIGDVTQFDASFFNMMPKDAEVTDPSHRLVLEESWNALEDAGISKETIATTRGGVILGGTRNEYIDLLIRHNVPFSPATFSGNIISCTAGRVAHFLDIRGPVFTVDTACSSSLTAVGLAVDQLVAGNCDWLLCGGSNLILTETLLIAASKSKILSPDGVCRVFDENANGTGLGEGVGMVVLKRLEDAIASKDRIYGVILATEMNCDGLTLGLNAPNKKAQIDLQKSTHQKHGIAPSSIGYFEAHGTGTSVGDYIEFNALTESFQSEASQRHFCALGSVKSRLGHCMGASGILGLMNATLALHHRRIPALNVKTINPLLTLSESPFYFNSEPKEWDSAPNTPRRAGINSFGISGTNVYMVLEEAPARIREDEIPAYFPIVFSKKGLASGLTQMAQRLLDEMTLNTNLKLRDISYTLTKGRSQFRHRVGWVVNSREALKATLIDYIAHPRMPDLPEDCPESLSEIMSQFKSGKTVDWTSFFEPHDVQIVSLPTYPFERRRYWAPDAHPRPALAPKASPQLLPFLPTSLEFLIDFSPLDDTVRQHAINGIPIIAGAQQLATVIKVIHAMGEPLCIDAFGFRQMIDVPQAIQIKLSLKANTDSGYDVVLSNLDASTVYSSGQLIRTVPMTQPTPLPVESGISVSTQDILSFWDNSGIQFGPLYRIMTHIEYGKTTARSRIEINNAHLNAASGPLPFVIDAAFQTTGFFAKNAQNTLYLPGHIDRIILNGPLQGTHFDCEVHMTSKTEQRIICDMTVYDRDRNIRVQLIGFKLIRVPETARETPASEWIVMAPQWIAETPPMSERPLRIDIWTPNGNHDQDLRSIYERVSAMFQFQDEGCLVCVISEETSRLGHAIAGFARSVFKENSAFKIHILMPQDMALAKSALQSINWDALHTPEWIRVLPDQFLIQRYQPVPIPPKNAPYPLGKVGKTYLITGGFGALSMALATNLATTGASVVLMGRSQPDARLNHLPETMRYLSVDVSHRASLARALQDIGPIHGIFHLAGLYRDLRFGDKSPTDFFEILAPKVTGIDLLDELTQTQSLDFFVAFSSVSAAFGNSGQTDYALANGYMDGAMAEREQLRAKGLRSGVSLSIGWPLWKDGGMAPNPAVLRYVESQLGNTVTLSTAQGITYLMRLLAKGPGLTTFLPLGWSALRDPLMAALTASPQGITGTQKVQHPINKNDDLGNLLLKNIQSIFQEKFNFTADQVQKNSDIDELGLDSIAVMEFVDTCHVRFGLSMDPMAFMQFKTIGEIVTFILETQSTVLASTLQTGNPV